MRREKKERKELGEERRTAKQRNKKRDGERTIARRLKKKQDEERIIARQLQRYKKKERQESNRHHIKPRSRGGSDKEENLLTKPIFEHDVWHDLSGQLCLTLKEIMVLLPYWINERDDAIRKKALGPEKTRQLAAFRNAFNLMPEELIILLKLCYSDAAGNLDMTKLRPKQKKALRALFGEEKNVEIICEKIRSEWMKAEDVKTG